jgi:4-amino-4-deoxy-L-arabinose transferase-like glycosyltransferase
MSFLNSRFRLSPAAVIIASFALVKILFHLLLPEYGYHRDEMYYVAIADGFSFSNLDMPPGAPLYLKLFLILFGHSIKTVHLAAAVSGAIVIVFGCLIAKEFGGKTYAIILTGVFLLWSGFVIFGSLYSYDDVSFIVWAAVLYLLVRLLNGADQRLWLLVGLLLGIGMMTKLTILFLGLAIFVSLWLVKERRWFGHPWIWLGALIALLCAVPYALWQRDHGWYFLSYASTYASRTTHSSPVLEFLWNQLLPNNLLLVPVWLLGLGLLLFARQWAAYRFFGYCYLVLLISLFILGGQFYFMLTIYAVLVAAGSVRIEQWFDARSTAERPRIASRIVLPAAYTVLSLFWLPFVVPVLPVDLLVAYVKPLGVTAGVKTEDRRIADLPQHMGDRFGWEEMARDVATVYHQAVKNANGTVGVLTRNWGEASALHVYREQYGLPEPVTTDGWYYFDALQHHTFAPNYVAIGISRLSLQEVFTQVELRGVFTNPYCMPDERGDEIYFCSGPKMNLREYWMRTPGHSTSTTVTPKH